MNTNKTLQLLLLLLYISFTIGFIIVTYFQLKHKLLVYRTPGSIQSQTKVPGQ